MHKLRQALRNSGVIFLMAVYNVGYFHSIVISRTLLFNIVLWNTTFEGAQRCAQIRSSFTRKA